MNSNVLNYEHQVIIMCHCDSWTIKNILLWLSMLILGRLWIQGKQGLSYFLLNVTMNVKLPLRIRFINFLRDISIEPRQLFTRISFPKDTHTHTFSNSEQEQQSRNNCRLFERSLQEFQGSGSKSHICDPVDPSASQKKSESWCQSE